MKTLKDLLNGCIKDKNILEGATCPKCGMNHTFSEELLKQSAIEWIKELEEIDDNNIPSVFECKNCECEGYNGVCENIIKWIKHFFNLSDEDVR